MSKLRLLGPLAAAVLTVAAVAVSSSSPVAADDGWTLTSTCTPEAGYDAGNRQFRILNETDAASDVILRNGDLPDEVVSAPVGESFHLVDSVTAPDALNTTSLIVDGDVKSVANSNNRVCAVLVGTAECDPEAAATTVTWTIVNNSAGPATITDSDEPFPTDPIPTGGTAVAESVIDGPAAKQDVTVNVTVDLDEAPALVVTDTVHVGACAARATGITFTKTASVSEPEAGGVITYTYTAINNGPDPIEVSEIVDDQLGDVNLDPSTPTVIEPGASVTETINYVVRARDAGTTVENHAVIGVRAERSDAAYATAVAEASVIVVAIPTPVDPTDTSTTTTTAVGATPSSTIVVVVVTLPATGTGNATDVLIWLALAALASGLVAVRVARRA